MEQGRELPSDHRTQTIALIVISSITWANGRKQLFVFADETFMLWVYFVLVLYGRLKCSIKFFAIIIITTNEKKRVKYVIIKYAESPIYIRREQEKAFKNQPLNENNTKIMGTVIGYCSFFSSTFGSVIFYMNKNSSKFVI